MAEEKDKKVDAAQGTATTDNTASPAEGTAASPSAAASGTAGVEVGPTHGDMNKIEVKTVNAPSDLETLTDKSWNGYLDTLREAKERYAASMETPEEKAKRERTEKANQKLNVISDGIRALSNLFATARYAPNGYNHEKDNLYDKEDARQEKLRKEREANQAQYLNYALKLGEGEIEKGKALQALRESLDRMKYAKNEEERKAAAAEIEKQIAPFRQQEQEARAKRAAAEANEAEIRAERAGDKIDAEIGYYNRLGKDGGGSGSQKVGGYVVYDENGNVVPDLVTGKPYWTDPKAAQAYSDQHGYTVTARTDVETSTNEKETIVGTETNTKTTNKDVRVTGQPKKSTTETSATEENVHAANPHVKMKNPMH